MDRMGKIGKIVNFDYTTRVITIKHPCIIPNIYHVNTKIT